MKMKFDHRFVASFGTFMDSLRELINKETSAQGWTAEYEEGYKYIRVVIVNEHNGNKQKSAWGFIDKRTGDIFRAASWKAPSLNHIRGNIYDESNGMKFARWTGPSYIWEINGKEKEETSVTTTTAPATEVV